MFTLKSFIIFVLICIILLVIPVMFIVGQEHFTDADSFGASITEDSATLHYEWDMTATVPLTEDNFCTTCKAMCL